jgi:FkbM family methyltransferase
MSGDPAEIFRSYVNGLPMNLLILDKIFNVRVLEFQPRPGSPLALDSGQTVRIRMDRVLGPVTLANHFWQLEELAFVKRVTSERGPFALIDIGANWGLFSRQVMASSPMAKTLFAYEPEPENFSCLSHNLSFHADLHLSNVALAAESGEADLFVSERNAGNNSLVSDAMESGELDHARRVPTVAVPVEASRWLETGLPLLYKSDTQGMDEVILASVPTTVWEHVFAGIIEVWRVDKPKVSQDVVRAVLDRFPYKAFLNNPDQILSTDAVMEALVGDDRVVMDLGFWR